MPEEEEGASQSSGFAGMVEKASIEYLQQVVQPLREIKDTMSRLRKDLRLTPLERLSSQNYIQSRWQFLRTSTETLCEVSGYPYPTRLKYAKQRVDIEYAVKKKEYIAKGKNPGKLIGFYTRKLMLLYIGETERALYKCGVLLSPLYS